MSTAGTTDADSLAIDRVLAVGPELFALERAVDRLHLGRHQLLHAGPPLRDPRAPCTPVLHSAMVAALLEGWADTADKARDMVRSGAIDLRPAQDFGCVLPLADVLSPSMWVQVVRDAADSRRWACSPLNGGAAHVMRVGVFDDAVLAHLRWLDREFAPAYGATVARTPIRLIPLADQGLAAGDDCHGKTGASTAAFAHLLADRLRGDSAPACSAFLERSPGFFLNLWMAASRCILSAAAGSADSSVVTAAAGNGQDFGIQLAGRPGHWFTVAADAPVIPGATEQIIQASLGAIGDSAIMDLLGLGAMTTLGNGAQAPAAFSSIWPETAQAPRRLLCTRHAGFERTQVQLVVRAASVMDSATSPVISLGVLDRAGLQGRLGGGFYRAPAELFARACAGLST